MSALELRPVASCRYDLVALGEVMLRLDPGAMRIRTTRSFDAWEGGGEYNVARGLHRCFGLDTAIVTSLVDNPVGRLIEDLICQGGVDRSQIAWVPSDGVGRESRNGLNFTERGFGVRGAVGCSDRGHTAASQMRPGAIDWDGLFGRLGARWLHCGGIFCALSDTTASVALEAFAAARRHGTIISYDLNYRESLWQSIGGPARAAEVNRELVANVEVVVGNEEDFHLALGFAPASGDEKLLELDHEAYGELFARVQGAFPNLHVLAATLRAVHSASSNDWGAVCRVGSERYVATLRPGLEIYDRVGGGDSFASGLIYGLLSGLDPQQCVEYGAAHGALAMTTPGDVSMATLAEVRKLAGGGSARVSR
jgi:2-dehydro-3-deoxygluconokinase